MKRIVAIVTIALMLALPGRAQDYRFEVGPALGVSGYLGDVNNSNLFKHPGLVGGGVMRYILNSRWAFKASLLYVGLKGDSKDIDTKFPGGQTFDFTSSVYDLGAQAEFNFWHFGHGARYKNYKRIAPYMVLGLGATLSHTGGKNYLTVNLPMGIGVKYKIKERLNVGFEFTMRKAFGDHVDGLSDLNGEDHGFAKNTDWYSVGMFTITYEFSKRCTKCHYVE